MIPFKKKDDISPPSPEQAGPGVEWAETIERLTAERDDALEKYKRALADFQNYHRRALLNEQEARAQGASSVLQSVVPVLDHLDLALGPAASCSDSESLMRGVKAIREEFVRVLESQGVGVLSPLPNDEFDPQRHQAMLRQSEQGVEPGRVVRTLRSGYTLNDRVIRPAQVTVAPAPGA
ncbi:MAG: nucleotide exchange factor GrpE [Phycisphaerae bacterium]|nr:nucleotide exchange factor GrpE [Phycisphaerae bacterium]